MNIDVSSLDLNLVKLIAALIKFKTTKAAADQLGMSQASVSRNLAKANQAFGAPLFVRGSHGMSPTALAFKLAAVEQAMLAPLQFALEDYFEFEPQQFIGELIIAIDPYIMEEQSPRMVTSLRHHLPQAQLKFILWNKHSLAELYAGAFDYCVLDQDMSLPQDVFMQPLYAEHASIIAKNQHPVLSQDFNWQQLTELPLVLLPAPNKAEPYTLVEQAYLDQGIQPRIAFTTHSLTAACRYLTESNAIMFGSSSTARQFSGLQQYPLPQTSLKLPDFRVFGGCLQTRRNQPKYAYLHQVMQDCFNPVGH
ncbi:LysR family transcriptional regulator [Motilimonas pumila]|uniref:LysR family transcriptional regulator n=1 Tax=Motilimonas pumila TaxID=2303987 RepID=A0A418YAQ8_9GAMM|nr:LysR family transcriptional regulator [Motilimonas pumila]RJG40043.1 LysR family transcriptional regulator [Motilimonas pumila]